MSSAPPDTDFNTDGKPHEQISRPTVRDDEISRNNFGAGYYDSSEVYQQTERFKQTINANASVGQAIERRALGEAVYSLARDGWTVTADDEEYTFPALDAAAGTDYEEAAKTAQQSATRRRDQEAVYGRLIYEKMPDYLQEHAILELSTLDERFDPPEMRVTKFFHEASRSKGGRLMDNVFGRVKKLISPNQNPAQNSQQRSWFGRGGGNQ